ncbi:MAG: hypothetical protein PWP52_1003 [Bacteroidales bacterium]|nr:hypothetical protein [Bacteroidales bacterium]
MYNLIFTKLKFVFSKLFKPLIFFLFLYMFLNMFFDFDFVSPKKSQKNLFIQVLSIHREITLSVENYFFSV